MNLPKQTENVVIAVDIGGTKIAAAMITDDGRILSRLVVTTRQKGPEQGTEQIISVIESLIRKSNVAREQLSGIGIGIPAVLENETDLIIWAPNLQGWRNVDLRDCLERQFNMPVCIEYDGHTAVLGEWWMGAAKDYQSVVSVIIGTGVGGGMVINGKIIRGVNRLAGAVGWFIIDRNAVSDPVKEKAIGSWESCVAGPGIAQRAKQILESQPETPSILKGKEKGVSAKDVFEAAKMGDALALQITSEEAELLGMGIANIISLVNPEIVVLGGSVGSNSAFLLPQIKSVVEQYAQPISCQSVKIVTSSLGTDAGLYGAGYGLLLRLKNIKHMV
ncbi:MAG: ROK family protein [Anaerolineales bacterium]|nr:ROK family protein [Anaerolineales bacterium]